MLDRRTFLVALACAAPVVAGCGVQAPGSVPSRLRRPDQESTAGELALDALVERCDAALGASEAWKATQEQVDAIEWCRHVIDEQRVAVGRTASPVASSTPSVATASPSPSVATASPVGSPATASPSPSVATASPGGSPATASPAVAGTPLKELAEALTKASPTMRAEALAATTVDPLAWASLAAWLPQAARALMAPTLERQSATTRLEPAPAEAAEAVSAAIDGAHQAAYGYEIVAGAPGLSPADADEARARTRGLRTLANTLTATAASPSPAEPAYQIARPQDAAQARALAVTLERALAPIVGRAIAHGPESAREALADALAASAAAVVAFGGPVPRWPGY